MSRRNASSESMPVTFVATFWKSWPLLPIGTLTTSKAFASGVLAIFGA